MTTFRFVPLAAVALAFAVTGCTQSSQSTPQVTAKELIYREYQNAIQMGDQRALRSTLSSDAVDEMERAGNLEVALSMMNAMTPTEVTVRNPLPVDERDDLFLKGSGVGFENSNGRVTYVREKGAWKIAKVEWQLPLDKN